MKKDQRQEWEEKLKQEWLSKAPVSQNILWIILKKWMWSQDSWEKLRGWTCTALYMPYPRIWETMCKYITWLLLHQKSSALSAQWIYMQTFFFLLIVNFMRSLLEIEFCKLTNSFSYLARSLKNNACLSSVSPPRLHQVASLEDHITVSEVLPS